MGITLSRIDDLRRAGALGRRVLDIGSSNLYSASEEQIRAFLAHYGKTASDEFVARLAAGSAYGPNGGINGSFVGELLEAAGMTYLSIDIAAGHRTLILDLNREQIGRNLAGSFDTVLNFGTTEHVINQLNAFSVIHDAAKVGGYIVHELPTSGYIDHGYFCYTPRFFFDLAGHNEYEIVDFAYSGPVAGKNIFGIVRDYRAYFPTLKKHDAAPETRTEDISSYLIVRKTKDVPLRLPMERSTSVVKEAAATR